MKRRISSKKQSMISKSVYINPNQIVSNNESVEKSNVLINKIKSFKVNFSQAFCRERNKSVKYQLANSIFIKSKQDLKRLQIESPKKMSSSMAKLVKSRSMSNPETHINPKVLFKTLTNQASTVPEYNKIIHDLLNEKKKLTKYIDDLKKRIIQQNKFHSKLQMHSFKHMNNTESTNLSSNKNINQRQRANFNIDLVCEQINLINYQQNQINKQSIIVIENIKKQKQKIEHFDTLSKITKKSILTTDKQLVNLKAGLQSALKTMNHNSLLLKQLQNQRAEMLLFINKSFRQNKLKEKEKQKA